MQGRFAFVMVTTLERLLLNGNCRRRAARRARRDAAAGHRAQSVLDPRRSVRRVPRPARPAGGIRGVHFERGDEIRIEGRQSSVILDGEMFEANDDKPDRAEADRAGAVPPAGGLSR